MKKEELVAVFDLDGTISKYDTYLLFLFFCLCAMPARLLRSPLLVVYYLMFKAGFRSNHWLKARFLRLVAGGVGRQKLEDLSARFHVRTMQKNIKQGALDELEILRGQGYKIVIATASFSFYVSKIAESLAADELLCTVAEVDSDGCLTGHIQGKNCIGKEKARRVLELLESRGWAHLHRAYSDDKVDFPLLKLARVAYVIDPKPATEIVAGEVGYQILRWK